jgi:hypothetical protein
VEGKAKIIRFLGQDFVCVEDLRKILSRMDAGREAELAKQCAALVVVGTKKGDPSHRVLARVIGNFLIVAAGLESKLLDFK